MIVEVKVMDNNRIDYHAIGELNKGYSEEFKEYVIFNNSIKWAPRPMIIDEWIVKEFNGEELKELKEQTPEYWL